MVLVKVSQACDYSKKEMRTVAEEVFDIRLIISPKLKKDLESHIKEAI